MFGKRGLCSCLTLIYPLIAGVIHHHHDSLIIRVIGAPQMTSQPVSSIFLCSPLPLWDLANSRPWCCLPNSFWLGLPCPLPPFTVPCKMVLVHAHVTPRTRSKSLQVAIRIAVTLDAVFYSQSHYYSWESESKLWESESKLKIKPTRHLNSFAAIGDDCRQLSRLLLAMIVNPDVCHSVHTALSSPVFKSLIVN